MPRKQEEKPGSIDLICYRNQEQNLPAQQSKRSSSLG